MNIEKEIMYRVGQELADDIDKQVLIDSLFHNYHCVEVAKVTKEMTNWLQITFGPMGDRWFQHNKRIYFKHEKDWMWFELST
jgi:hypothetical protein